MSVRFPDEPGFAGRFAPVRMEGEIRGLEVTQGEATREHRFGVMNLTSVPGEKPADGLPGFRWLAAIDPETGALKRRFAGHDSTVQEAIFVPPGPDAPHGEGYVMQLVDRHATGTTDLLTLDARHIDAPPVATLRIPIRMPGGLHGNWVSEKQLTRRLS